MTDLKKNKASGEDLHEEAPGNRDNDDMTGETNKKETVPATKEQTTEKTKAKKRPADKAGTLPEEDPSNLKSDAVAATKNVGLDHETFETKGDGKKFNEAELQEQLDAIVEAVYTEVPEFSFKDELGTLLESQDLEAEFAAKVVTLFESAVNATIIESHDALTTSFQSALEEALPLQEAVIEARVSKYASYVAKQYLAENSVAIESGFRAQLNEKIVAGFLDVLAENNIDLPEEKADLFEEALEEKQELEDRISKLTEKTIELAESEAYTKKLLSLMKFSRENDLTEMEEQKLLSLTESFDFDQSFGEKLELLKENYFGSDEGNKDLINEDVAGTENIESTLNEKQSSNDPMDVYAAALSKLGKK